MFLSKKGGGAFALALSLCLIEGTLRQTPAAHAQGAASIPLPPGVTRVTSVEGITEYRLGNGLEVLLFPDASKPTVTVNITYLVGSRNENYGETGMAHLLEHLMFKGSKKHPNVPQELTEHGARPNGSTWLDRTNYFETFQASAPNLNWALDLESDRMVNSFIARKDLDSEMTVVRNEFESGENSPSRILTERAISAAFLWHSYGKSTIGARSDIENVPIDHLQAFWRTYYQPDNAVLLVAGKFAEGDTLAKIQAKFGAIPRPTRVLPKTYTEEPTQDGERSVTLQRVGDVQALCAVYHVPAGSHPDFAAINVLTQILGDTPSGRLYKALVATKQATDVNAYGYQLREPGIVVLSAQVPKDQSLETARATLLSVAGSLAEHPATDEEVERARAQILKQIELSLNSADDIGLAMSEWIAQGDWRLFFLSRDQTRDVTKQDVQRVALAYLKPSNRTVGMFIPTEKPDRAVIPPAPNIALMLKNYKGSAVVAAGEAFDPSPANIDARTQLAQAGGIRLSLLPKKSRGGSVVATLSLRFGNEKDLFNRATAGRLAGQMLLLGTTTRTRQQIQDAFDKIKANVSVYGSPMGATATIQTTRENLPATLRIVADALRAPSFPASEFEQLKQRQITGFEQNKSDPGAVAFKAVQRHLSPYPRGDVRYVDTLEEEIADTKAASLDEVKKFYTDFYGASSGDLAVVGDFDAKEVETLTAELFGDWKSRAVYTRIPQVYQNLKATKDVFETPDKANAFFIATLPMKMRDDNADYPALVLSNYMLGGGFLNSRLATRIRQKEGLSYGIGSDISVSPNDEYAVFFTYAICAPQNASRVEAAFHEEIAKVVKEGFTPEEIVKAKQGYLQQLQVSRAQDGELANKLGSYRYLNRKLAFDAEVEKKISALTPAQINAALRAYLKPNDIAIVKSGDFKGHPNSSSAP